MWLEVGRSKEISELRCCQGHRDNREAVASAVVFLGFVDMNGQMIGRLALFWMQISPSCEGCTELLCLFYFFRRFSRELSPQTSSARLESRVNECQSLERMDGKISTGCGRFSVIQDTNSTKLFFGTAANGPFRVALYLAEQLPE